MWLHLTPEYKIIHGCSCCHGNKVSIATRSLMNCYCPYEQMYQILTSSDQNAKLLMNVLVAMVIRFPQQHDYLWIFIALMNKCTKYELHLTPECKVIDECSCCHGNKVSIATRSLVNCYCPNEQMYQI